MISSFKNEMFKRISLNRGCLLCIFKVVYAGTVVDF